jgi:hypothetical protein
MKKTIKREISQIQASIELAAEYDKLREEISSRKHQ